MKELTSIELKTVELDILKNVANFCDVNHLRYNLGGGTLLGAVRHKGFIPWDDDIDISMPRPDYMKFIEKYNGSSENYFVKSIENDGSYIYTNAKVYDKRTYLKDFLVSKSLSYSGVHIDIFPVDGIPETHISREILYLIQRLLIIMVNGSSMRYIRSHKYYDSTSSLANILGIFRTIMKFSAISIFKIFPTNKLVKLVNSNLERYSYNKSEYVACLVACIHGASCEKMRKMDFEHRIKLQFEDLLFWSPACYKLYLQNLYGDYMKLPPVENRKPHHNFKAYWR